MGVVRKAFFLILGAAGLTARCGLLADTGDASDDASTDPTMNERDTAVASCNSGVFSSPMPLVDLNTSQDERGLRMTPDGRLGAFSRGSIPSNAQIPVDGGVSTILIAQHDTTSDTWTFAGGYDGASAGDLHCPETGAQWCPASPLGYPSLTEDGLRLFVEGAFAPVDTTQLLAWIDAGYSGWQLPLFLGERDASTAPLHGLYYVAGLPRPTEQYRTFGFLQAFGDGYVTQDGGAYYYTAVITDGAAYNANTVNGIYVNQQVAPFRPPFTVYPEDGNGWGAFFGDAATLVVAPPSSQGCFFSDCGGLVDNPVPSVDELTLFMSQTDATGVPHVAIATRMTTSVPFSTPQPVHELDSMDGEYPTWLSPDRCRLYITRRVGGQWDLFVASRTY